MNREIKDKSVYILYTKNCHFIERLILYNKNTKIN